MTDLFYELFSGLSRHGPGDVASTLRATASISAAGLAFHPRSRRIGNR